MKNVQDFCCSIIGVLLFLLLQESHAEEKAEIVHKAVGCSLDLTPDYPKTSLTQVEWKFNQKAFAEYDNVTLQHYNPDLFDGRLRKHLNNISVTLENLQLQDSGNFSIVQSGHAKQYPTKTIVLHVYDVIKDVKINQNVTWLQSKRMCTFHLVCVVSGHPSPSYSWSGYQVGNGPQLYFNLTPEASATLNCTANNSVSVNYTTETVLCKEEHGSGIFWLLIVVGAGIVGFAIVIGIVGGCYRWITREGKGESKDAMTVYEDVKTESVTKKRSESVINGMSIYETVDDMKVTSNVLQTVYDKINYQRHPVVTPSTSSPYQDVL